MAIGPIKKGAYHEMKGISKDKKISASTERNDAKHGKSKLLRERAQFALNARKWSHKGSSRKSSR